jgi:hypothetical protein
LLSPALLLDALKSLGGEAGNGAVVSSAQDAVAARLAALGHVEEALSIADSMSDARGRSECQHKIIDAVLPSADRALQLAAAIPVVGIRAKSLLKVAARLDQSLWRRTFDDARALLGSVWNVRDRAEVLKAGALCAAVHREPQLALSLVKEIEVAERRGEALAAVMPLLPVELGREAAAMARRTAGVSSYLVATAATLPPQLRREVVAAALENVERIGDDVYRASAVGSWPTELVGTEKLLSVGLQMDNAVERAHVIAELAKVIDVTRMPSVLDQVKRWRDGTHIGLVVAKSAGRMARAGMFETVLPIAGSVLDHEYRAEALLGVAMHVPEPVRSTLGKGALRAAKNIEDPERGTATLAKCYEYMSESEREAFRAGAVSTATMLLRSYQATVLVEHGWFAVSVMENVAPFLLLAEVDPALAIGRNLGELAARQAENFFPYVLRRLANLGHAERAVEHARALTDLALRARALTAIASTGQDVTHVRIREEAVCAVRQMAAGAERCRQLIDIAETAPDSLSEALLEEAAALARGLGGREGHSSRWEPFVEPEQALARIAALRAADSGPAAFALLSEVLRRLSEKTRLEVFAAFRELGLACESLGSCDALGAVVADVALWWP